MPFHVSIREGWTPTESGDGMGKMSAPPLTPPHFQKEKWGGGRLVQQIL